MGECSGNTVLSCLHILSNPLFYTAMWLWSLKKCGMFFLVPLLKISKVMGAHPSSQGAGATNTIFESKAISVLYIIPLYMLRKENDVHLDDEKIMFFFPFL